MSHIQMLGSLLAALCLLCPVATHASPKTAQKSVEKAISTEQAVQKKVENWQDTKSSLVVDIQNMQHELQWLTFQNTKYSRYNEALENNIAELERQQKELEKITSLIDPLLEQTVTRMESFISADLPFLQQERHGRMEKLRQTLGDPHLSQAEQLRRVLEALSIEIAYGRMIESEDESVTLDNASLRATTLRAGRLGYYCISPDKQLVGKWSQEKQQFISLSPEEARHVLVLQDLAKRKQLVEVTPLPVELRTSMPVSSAPLQEPDSARMAVNENVKEQ